MVQLVLFLGSFTQLIIPWQIKPYIVTLMFFTLQSLAKVFSNLVKILRLGTVGIPRACASCLRFASPIMFLNYLKFPRLALDTRL